MHAHDARSGRYLTTESGKPIPHEVLAFLLSGRRASAHVTITDRGEANRLYDAATRYLKGEHANMKTDRALRTTISIELGHNDREPIKTMLGGQTYGKAPTVTVECEHEGFDPDDERAALWHDDAVTAATQCARMLLESVGLATVPEQPAPRGAVFVSIKGDTSKLVAELAAAEQAAREAASKRVEGRVLRSDEQAPDAYVQHDTSLPDEEGAEHPRYRDAELESVAVEVGCAMFGEAYRDWLDSDDQYGVAARERGAGALHAAAYVEHMKRQS